MPDRLTNPTPATPQVRVGHGLDVPSFVGHLKLFWTYGISPPGSLSSPGPLDGWRKAPGHSTGGVRSHASVNATAYRPPHQRRTPNGELYTACLGKEGKFCSSANGGMSFIGAKHKLWI